MKKIITLEKVRLIDLSEEDKRLNTFLKYQHLRGSQQEYLQ